MPAKKKPYSFGGATIADMSPARSDIKRSTKTINLSLTFEEALKLNLALDESVRRLNKMNRSTSEGRGMMTKLILHLDKDRLVVHTTP